MAPADSGAMSKKILPPPAPLQRVSIVSETYAPEANGVATTLSHLVAGLRQDTTRVDLIVPRHPARPRGQQINLYSVCGVSIPGYREVRCGLARPRLLEELWRSQRPDAVYIATEGPLGWSAQRAAARLRLPTVSGFHTRFDTYASHYGLGPLNGAVQRYLRRFHNRTDRTLVPDTQLAEALTERGYRNVETLGRGVDTHRFHPDRRSATLRAGWGVDDRAPVLLYVGRLAAEKNLGLAIEAFRYIQQAQPGARMVLVGDGPMRAELQRQHPDLIFAGVRRGADLARYYASADLFLFPSLSETFGNVTLEALASGVPVIAFDYAAAHRHVEDAVSGRLVARDDPGGWIEAAVGSALLAPETRQRWQKTARAGVESLSWQHITRRFGHILAEAVRGHDGLNRGGVTLCSKP